jgi:hypothetical protein
VVLFEVPFLGRAKYGLVDGENLEDLPSNLRSRQRYDALAVGIWPSSKQLVHGFELKVSRSDLLHELRDLTKSEEAARNVDRFWLVLGDKTILRDTDLVPDSWGILAAVGRGLRIIRDAQPQEGALTRSLLIGAVTRSLVQPTIGREVRYRDALVRSDKEYRQQLEHIRASSRERENAQRARTWHDAAYLAEQSAPALAELFRDEARRCDAGGIRS